MGTNQKFAIVCANYLLAVAVRAVCHGVNVVADYDTDCHDGSMVLSAGRDTAVKRSETTAFADDTIVLDAGLDMGLIVAERLT
jgi:hypothetical protein